jgi:hypothetical protein
MTGKGTSAKVSLFFNDGNSFENTSPCALKRGTRRRAAPLNPSPPPLTLRGGETNSSNLRRGKAI